jgi:hypothetical protein
MGHPVLIINSRYECNVSEMECPVRYFLIIGNIIVNVKNILNFISGGRRPTSDYSIIILNMPRGRKICLERYLYFEKCMF